MRLLNDLAAFLAVIVTQLIAYRQLCNDFLSGARPIDFVIVLLPLIASEPTSPETTITTSSTQVEYQELYQTSKHHTTWIGAASVEIRHHDTTRNTTSSSYSASFS